MKTAPSILLRAIAVVALGACESRALDVRVVDAASRRPLGEASVAWRIGEANSSTNITSAKGVVKIPVPTKSAYPLHLTASKPGFAPMSMRWDAGKVPAKFDLALSASESIGGRVADEAGKPVAGASLTLVLPQRLAGPRVAVEEFAVKSDADGRWRCDFVPKDTVYVFVEVAHPDYESPSGETSLETLRAGTAQLKLYAVATVRGRVLDESGHAVPDAELTLGSERDIWPSSSTLEARTDAEGRFEFARIRLEKRLLGVSVPAFAPAMQLLDIRRDATAVEVRLKPGSPLRVRVMDPTGRPIAGVAAKVDEWSPGSESGQVYPPGRWAYPGWEWETDAEGRLNWSNAPAGPLRWSFTKGGYMTRSRHTLNAASGEQVVTLGLPFRATGSVNDAATGRSVNEFVLTPRYARVDSFNGVTRTNTSPWYEYNRKPFSGGKFAVHYDHPMLSGSSTMHDWQFRVEADGYEPAVSRLVRDDERGLQLGFHLTPRPLPDIAVTAPTATRRVTAGIAVQPCRLRPGDTLTLFVKARVAAGHHIYALEDSGCSNLPTTLDAALRGVLTPDGPWSGPEPKALDDGSRTLAGDLLFQRRFIVSSGLRGNVQECPVILRFQACNEALCWPVETISLATEFELITSPE